MENQQNQLIQNEEENNQHRNDVKNLIIGQKKETKQQQQIKEQQKIEEPLVVREPKVQSSSAVDCQILNVDYDNHCHRHCALLQQLQKKQTQQLQQYYILPDIQNQIIGSCKEMISKEQKNWRTIDDLEEYPYKMVAKYFRNRNYSKEVSQQSNEDKFSETRTPQTLKATINYLITDIFSLLLSKKHLERIFSGEENSNKHITKVKQMNTKLTKKVSLVYPENVYIFIDDRIRAVKCELSVQGVVWPQLMIRILKCEIVLSVIWANRPSQLASNGLDFISNEQCFLDKIQADHYHIFQEMMMIAILTCKKIDLLRLLNQKVEIITEDPELQRVLALRLLIQRGNYNKFFKTLMTQKSMLIKCLLWLHVDRVRNHMLDVLRSVKKCSMLKGELNLLMGFRNQSQAEKQELVNIFEQQQYVQKKRQNWLQPKQYQTWFKYHEIYDQLLKIG